VTYPLGRDPLELASLLATLSELVGDSREVVLGFGTGGGGPRAFYRDDAILRRTREFLDVVQRLVRGERVRISEYRTLAVHGGFRETAELQLTVPVRRSPPVILTGTGPRILRMAGELADGVLCASNFPVHSYAAFRSGAFSHVSNLAAVDEGLRTRDSAGFRRIYGINVSVGRDGDAARAYARRQAALIVGQETDENLARAGIDVEALTPTRVALQQGLPNEVAAARLPLAVADSLIIAGTPAECIPRVEELRAYAASAGFEEFYVGSPLGPNAVEAVSLLAREVVPRVWA